MAGIEVAGLVIGVIGLMGLVPTFREGFKLARARREKGGLRLLNFMTSSTKTLENETQNGGMVVEKQYYDFHAVYGDAFKRGDGIARETLLSLIVQLQSGLIDQLKDGKKVQDMSRMVSLTVTSRAGAIAALSELAQRLATAMPIGRYPPAPRNSTNGWNFMYVPAKPPNSPYSPYAPMQYAPIPYDPPNFQYDPPSFQYDPHNTYYVPPNTARRGGPEPRPRLLEYPSTQSTASSYSVPSVRRRCKRVNKNTYETCGGEKRNIPRPTRGPVKRCNQCNQRLTAEALTGSSQFQDG